MTKVEWEVFLDRSYYDMWAVRPVGDKEFDSPRLFHFDSEVDSRDFLRLVNKASVAMDKQ